MNSAGASTSPARSSINAIDLPPFPDNIPTHPLVVIDYARIVAGDAEDTERLWMAGTTLGFWYLKNHGADEEVRGMFEMGLETMGLPLEEKMKYEQGDEGLSFGRYPVTKPQERTPSIPQGHTVNNTLLDVFNLALPPGTLTRLHQREAYSGCAARVVYSPPIVGQQVISAHTDFGSLSFLHNRLGGLQVCGPGTDSWQYVKPIRGHAICNIGDAMAILSGGVLRSNMHRVVNPPGEQGSHHRFSLVCFTRPSDSVVLCALTACSGVIADAVQRAPDPARYDTGATALEWLARRVKYRRAANLKEPEAWIAGRGTEHTKSTEVLEATTSY